MEQGFTKGREDVSEVRRRPTRKKRLTEGKEIKRRPGNAKHDWETVRRNYIEGIEKPDSEERWYPTLKELAELHKIAPVMVRQRSSEERWPSHREAANMIATQERQRKRARMVAKNALDFDERGHDTAKVGMAMVMTRLGEIAAQVAAQKPMRDDAIRRLRNGESVTKQELYSVIRAQELQELASAAERFQSVGMRALGTDVQRVDVTGMGGIAGDVNVSVNVNQELQRDDIGRLTEMMGAMKDADLLPPGVYEALMQDEVMDAEVVDDDDDTKDAQDEPRQTDTSGRSDVGSSDGPDAGNLAIRAATGTTATAG